MDQKKKKFVKLTPSNNSTTGYSTTGSQPIIRFSLADSQALANLKECRLNARVKVVKTGTTAVAIGDDFNIDPVCGFSSMISQINVSSRRFGNTMEQVTNLGRLESSYYRTNKGVGDMAGNHYSSSCSLGLGRVSGRNGVNNSPNSTRASDRNFMALRKKLITVATASPSKTDPDLCEVSIPFHTGMFLSGQDLDLSAVGGLEIAIYLERPESVFFGSAVTSSSSYTLYDVSLTVPVMYKSVQQIQSTPKESLVQFLEWTSLYSVVDSTSASISHRLFLKGLVSAIHSFLPTNQINNTAFNSLALKNPGVEKLTFTRDGQRAPLEKTMICPVVRTDSVYDKTDVYPEVMKEYASAWDTSVEKSQNIPQNLKGDALDNGVFGIGVNYSPDSSGINMSGVLGIDIQSKLENITTPTPGGTESYAMYSYYLNRKAFVASANGLVAV